MGLELVNIIDPNNTWNRCTYIISDTTNCIVLMQNPNESKYDE